MPSSGNYLLRIALADAMVIDFWPKKMSCDVVKLLFEASVKRHKTDTLLSSLKQQAV